MASLDLRVPPLLMALLVAVTLWCLPPLAAFGQAPVARVPIALAIALAGAAVSIAGTVGFRRARTTVNPLKPASASTLVVTGVYRVTRNPMYLGLALLVAAWAVYLWSLWALFGPIAFVAYVGRFQVAPEERALASLFGSDDTAYKTRVRRWL